MEKPLPSPAGLNALKSPKPPKTPTESKASSEKKLSGADIKKQRQAEKTAKRAAKKDQNVGPSESQNVASQSQSKLKPLTPIHARKQSQGLNKIQPSPLKMESKELRPRDLPLRRKSSFGASAVQPPTADTKVALFGHLYVQPRRHGIAGTSKEVHPSVLALGLQMSSYEICGSTARCVAMLLAFKNVRLLYQSAFRSKRDFNAHSMIFFF